MHLPEETRPMVIRRRLLKLASFLEKLPRRRFDYETWGRSKKTTDTLAVDRCGTAGCALGWACSMPEFRKLGLRLYYREGFLFPSYNGTVGTDALAVGGTAFGTHASCELFYPDAGAGYGARSAPRKVAERIRLYVAKNLPTRDEIRAKRGLALGKRAA